MNRFSVSEMGSVWFTGQRTARAQRIGRYVPDSRNHPGKMLPAIAARAIATYTQPGDLVIDPMCGTGTTLVEAAHQNRHAIGIEYEPAWVDLARRNLSFAKTQGAAGDATVSAGDARNVLPLLAKQLGTRGQQATLVLTSPPYGPSVHGQVNADSTRPVIKSHDSYSNDAANLAHQPHDLLVAGFTQILAGCRQLLKPGGVLAVTARPYRRRGLLVDIPGEVHRAAVAAGFTPHERLVCLLACVDGQILVPRASFFQLHGVRQARVVGNPMSVIAHEDLLVFRAA
jgi:modification methylase